MLIVVFEFTLNKGVGDRYFELAGMMREEIQNQPGFISIERFRHLDDEDRVVSISTGKRRCHQRMESQSEASHGAKRRQKIDF